MSNSNTSGGNQGSKQPDQPPTQQRPSAVRLPSTSSRNLSGSGNGGSGSGRNSPQSAPLSPISGGVRPPLKSRASGPSQRRHHIYSTDDDENEVEADNIAGQEEELPVKAPRSNRRIKKSKSGGQLTPTRSRSIGHQQQQQPQQVGPYFDALTGSNSISDFNLPYTPHSIEEQPEQEARREEPVEPSAAVQPPRQRERGATNEEGNAGDEGGDNNNEDTEEGQEEGDHGDEGEEDEEEEDDNDDEGSDAESTSSTETFTLRERQDAINTTHPFGIRIWKPAIYKKSRSVQKIAEGDIHSTPGKTVTWTVRLGNVIWTLVFGLIMLLVCTVASASCMIFTWSPSAKHYGKKLFSLGVYLAFPFGRFVELAQDENYLHEDIGEGRSLAEYHRWQAGDVEHGRLFFEPSRRHEPATTTTEENGGDSNETLINQDDSGDASEPLLSRSNSDSSPTNNNRKRRLFGRGEWNLGRIIFYLWFYFIIAPLLYVISIICWLGVFSIPMAKVTGGLADQLRRHPLALSFKPASLYLSTSQSSSIILSTYRAFGWNYYKYTIDGTNIFFINLMFPVIFVILDFYFFAGYVGWGGFLTSPATLFSLALVSVVPLAYFIGQAVASISAQSSMGMGAAINAFFATIVEVYLYAVALNQGKGDLVEGSIVGSILAGVLFLPGISMCAGAIKRKTQRYNPKSAGVSSTMLIFAVIGVFAPTLFYQIYGTYEVHCSPCRESSMDNGGNNNPENCSRCQMYQLPLERDNLYTQMIQPFSYFCAVMLFISYVIGLWFTLRTHANMIWSTPTASELGPNVTNPRMDQAHSHYHHQHHQHGNAPTKNLPPPAVSPYQDVSSATNTSAPVAPTTSSSQTQQQQRPSIVRRGSNMAGGGKPNTKHVSIQTSNPNTPAGANTPAIQPKESNLEHSHGDDDSGGGHDAPNWGRAKSTVILLGATVLYAIIAEILVDTVDVVLQNFNIGEKLLGITIFALVPNTTEFLNAISFAINGNIALSMEIGSAYALQVCLLQTPALVLYSIWSQPTVQGPIHDFMFTLVFPKWDLCMVIFCVFLFSYIYAEGKSNYFKGSILILAYLVATFGFFIAAKSDDNPGIDIVGNTMIFMNQGSNNNNNPVKGEL